MSFEINCDLDKIKLNLNNACHIVICFIIALLFGFWWSYGVGCVWEIWNGFCKWHYQAPYETRCAKFPSVNWFKKEFLYSDKFSIQDLIWNFIGAFLGAITKHLVWN